MYFVDRKKIEETLEYFNTLLKEVSNHKFETFAEKLYLERTVHMAIESILDVGNMMIDGFIMRDPGSYEDIIDILVDEKVVPEHDADDYKSFIELRKMVVKEYLQIDHTALAEALRNNNDLLNSFSDHIRSYLDNELGVANAFSNE
ncbi:DUF86 domain-containing protein [Virgibacillus kekensis]|uniref:DUF86 domain-containing protein n=1 Tax=Virgibacillus kekensis TaxID=202261 RepID=A0ABV9DIG7_9BACI